MKSILVRSAWLLCVWLWVGLVQADSGAVTARRVSVADMGLSEPVTFSADDNEKHFFFPLPPVELLESATLELEGRWFRAYDEASVLTLLVNGEPVLTYPLGVGPQADAPPHGDGVAHQADGVAHQADGVGASRSSSRGRIDEGLTIAFRHALRLANLKGDFLDLGIVLGARMDAEQCIDERGRGNELVLDTHRLSLSYTYRSGNITNVRSFLATLPRRVDVLLPGKSLTSGQYETALRIARGLASMGLATRFVAIPREGDIVPVDGIPASLPWDQMNGALQLGAAVANGKPFKIATPEESAAWLVARMMSAEGLAQIVVDPVATKRHLLTTISRARSDMVFREVIGTPNEWIFDAGQEKMNLAIGNIAGRSVLMVENANAAGLLGSIWKQVVTTREAGIQAVDTTRRADDARFHFAREASVQYVATRGEWQLPVRLSDLASQKWPESLELDMIAAPNTDGRPVIASVLLNDTLLMSAPLLGDGKVTTIRAPIPLYSVRAENWVRVQVNRRPDARSCARPGDGTPVQLLPTSFVTTRDAPEPTRFFMLQPVFDKGVDVVIPRDWLDRSLHTLETVDAVLEGYSLRAPSVTLSVSETGDFAPLKPWIAFEVRPKGAALSLAADESRLMVRDQQGRTVFDSTGLRNLSVMELATVGHVPGVFVAPVGGKLPLHPREQKFVEGSFMISDTTGSLLTLDLMAGDAVYHVGEEWRWIDRYTKHWRVLLLGLFLLLAPTVLVLGARALVRRRHLAG